VAIKNTRFVFTRYWSTKQRHVTRIDSQWMIILNIIPCGAEISFWKRSEPLSRRQSNYIYKCLLCSISDELSRRKEFEETSEKENPTNIGKNVLEFVTEIQKYV